MVEMLLITRFRLAKMDWMMHGRKPLVQDQKSVKAPTFGHDRDMWNTTCYWTVPVNFIVHPMTCTIRCKWHSAVRRHTVWEYLN